MRGRRTVFLLIASALLFPPLRYARAAADPVRAADFIRHAGEELAGVIGGATTPEEKRARLQPFIDRVVDVEGVARFCLGRFWKHATPEQQQTYTALFHRVLLNNIVVHMGDYQQTKVEVVIGRPEAREAEVLVPTTVAREGTPPAHVVWVVQDDGANLRIVDVIAEGTSLRLTVRSDFNAFLTRHDSSIAALIDALREQAAG